MQLFSFPFWQNSWWCHIFGLLWVFLQNYTHWLSSADTHPRSTTLCSSGLTRMMLPLQKHWLISVGSNIVQRGTKLWCLWYKCKHPDISSALGDSGLFSWKNHTLTFWRPQKDCTKVASTLEKKIVYVCFTTYCLTHCNWCVKTVRAWSALGFYQVKTRS